MCIGKGSEQVYPKTAHPALLLQRDSDTFGHDRQRDPGADKATELSFRVLCSAASQHFTTYLKGDKIIGSFVSGTYNVHFQVCLRAQLRNLTALK